MKALSPLGPALCALSLFLTFLGERVIGEGDGRAGSLGLAALSFLAGLALVGRDLAVEDGPTRGLVRDLLSSMVACGAGVGLYFLAASMREGDKATAGMVEVLGFVVLFAGALVLFALSLVAGPMRRAQFVEQHRVRWARSWALGTALAIAAVAMFCFAAEKSDVRKDFSFGGPTAPSGATKSLLEATKCKPEIVLFFERGSTSYSEVAGYFEALQHDGVPVQRIDQALDPQLAKDLKVSRNGTVAVKCGERSEIYYVGDDREAAQRKVGKLDEEMRTRLAKLTRDPKQVYFTVGHGERSIDDSDKEGRSPAAKLKKLAEAMNAKTKRLGLAEGLGKAIPDDAAAVVVVGPTSPFLPSEADALALYVERGGSLFLLLDPGVDHGLSKVLDQLQVKMGDKELDNDKEFVRKSYTDADRAFLFSSSFGTHKSVKTLNGARGKVALLFLEAGTVEKIGDGKPVAIARTRPATWQDLDGDRTFDDGVEKKGVFDFAMAIEKAREGGPEARAIVAGDSDVVSDLLLANEANAVFAYDGLLWLLRDDADAGGSITNDEDVAIRHTRDQDTLWFYGTTFAAPLLVLVGGLLFVRVKRRGKK